MPESEADAKRHDGPEHWPWLGWQERIRRGVVIVMLAMVAVGGAFVGIRSRERDDAFLDRQFHPTVVSRPDVEQAVTERTGGVSASCRAGSSRGALRNPWSCRVRARDGQTERFVVRVGPSGAYTGRGSFTFRGCCVAFPTPD